MKVLSVNLVILFFLLNNTDIIYSQQNNLQYNYNLKNKSQISWNAEIALYTFAFLSVVNPIIVYENKKIYFGITRELTLAIGKKGEYRLSAEYSYLFRKDLKHHLLLSAKYDILSELLRSEWLDMRTSFSIGGGYFIDADGKGIFPEITAAYRIGEDLYIIQPYIKLRHTFMFSKEKPDITDISLGMILGIKPF